MNFLHCGEEVGELSGREVCHSWDLAVGDDQHVTRKDGFYVYESAGEGCFVENLRFVRCYLRDLKQIECFEALAFRKRSIGRYLFCDFVGAEVDGSFG